MVAVGSGEGVDSDDDDEDDDDVVVGPLVAFFEAVDIVLGPVDVGDPNTAVVSFGPNSP